MGNCLEYSEKYTSLNGDTIELFDVHCHVKNNILIIYCESSSMQNIIHKYKKYMIKHKKIKLNKLQESINNLPNEITHLMLDDLYDEKIITLPLNLEKLIIGCNFNKPLGNDNLPQNLKKIEFIKSDFFHIVYQYTLFNQKIDNLPNSLETLILSDEFNQQVPNLPHNLINLKFGIKFNQDVSCLPFTITNLEFGRNFNQSVDNLPNSIITLKFGDMFNQSVDNLPNSIKNLTFGDKFNQPINCLPNSINLIVLGYHFNQPLNCLPNSINSIVFGYHFNQPINCLVNCLTHVVLDCYSYNYIDDLHKSIKYLNIYHNLNKPFKKINNSITHLFLGEKFNHPIDMLIGLKFLQIDSFNTFNIQNIINSLPQSIETIEFTNTKFNYQLKNLPFGLKSVIFNHDNNTFIERIDDLSDSVEYIELPKYFDRKIRKFPSQLKTIKCSKNNYFIKDYSNYDVILY